MVQSNADSWQLTSGVASATAHAVLFLRDAFQLKPEDESHIPPHLLGDVPDLSAIAPDHDAREVATSWTAWWEHALAFEVAGLCGDDGSDRARDEERAQFFDPPEFASLSESPSLRSIARSAHREALRWSKFHSAPSPDALRYALRDSVASPVVWETCVARHVSPGRLRATVLALNVEGLWATYPRAGVVVCSLGVLRKESHLQECLREAFHQTLARDA